MMIVYAPGVHTGGGRTLLSDLLQCLSGEDMAVLDARFGATTETTAQVDYVKPTLFGRITAERSLLRQSRDARAVICFSGLPPLLRLRSKTVVFVQNRLLLDPAGSLSATLVAKRLIFRAAAHHADSLVVQSASMARCAQAAGFDNVVVAPFFPPTSLERCGNRGECPSPRPDFFYPADGYSHKNHAALFAAWEILAGEGVRPILGVTLSSEFDPVWRLAKDVTGRSEARIVNYGRLDRRIVIKVLASAKAMIYPSLKESFGLPLLEAGELGIPVLAGELDYVRDVALPRETFDPTSPLSIARAVKRFLKAVELPVPVYTAHTWLSLVSRL